MSPVPTCSGFNEPVFNESLALGVTVKCRLYAASGWPWVNNENCAVISAFGLIDMQPAVFLEMYIFSEICLYGLTPFPRPQFKGHLTLFCACAAI